MALYLEDTQSSKQRRLTVQQKNVLVRKKMIHRCEYQCQSRGRTVYHPNGAVSDWKEIIRELKTGSK